MKREKIWALVILALMALSVWVILGTHYDAKTHRHVANYPTKYGLDIKGGVRAVLQAQTQNLPNDVKWNGETQSLVRNILEKRINGAGVGEATVQLKGTDQYIIELPDVKNKDAILNLLGTTASMTFYYFRDVTSHKYTNRPLSISESRSPDGKEVATLQVTPGHVWQGFRAGETFRDGGQIRTALSQLIAQGAGQRPGATLYKVPAPLADDVPTVSDIYFTPDQAKTADELNKELIAWKALLADSPPILTGADILPQSQARLGGNFGTEPEVTQQFAPKGADAMGRFTSAHIGEIMGIVLDDSILSAPVINGRIDDQGEISGGFKDLKEAQNLADLLNAGALPVPLKQIQVQSVEASLGQGAVQRGLVAGIVGLALVLAFMLLFYRLPGLVADVALLIYALFTFAIFKGGLSWLGVPAVTMTEPGFAGFILSIGMAVDANILIFERLKEELRSGKSLRTSIDAGFRRAFTAIRDSNICTAITCIVLLSLGTPAVKGFALTLLIGVIISLFSAITVTRTLLYLLVDAGIGNNPKLFGLNVRSLIGRTSAAPDATPEHTVRPGLNIIGRRKFFYLLSCLIIIPGLIFWLGLHGIKKSIEFTGGSQIEVQYPRSVPAAQVEAAIKEAGFTKPAPHIQMGDGGLNAIVSVAQESNVANPALNPVHIQLANALNIGGVNSASTLPAGVEQQFGNVGGTISAELTSRAIQAVIIASILILLYLAMVFGIGGFVAGLRLGASAITALLHDVLVLLGAFAIFGYFLGWEIDSLFVTAMLTMIGFSVHDTVVIFDRVRENLRYKRRDEPFEPLVNRSIQETLSRSINTSLTVLMTLATLIILGGQSTRLLNVALFIGILSGTYSSIFNAASILVDWENWLAKRKQRGGPPSISGGTGGNGVAAVAATNGGSPKVIPQRRQEPAPQAPRRTPVPSPSDTGSSTPAGPGVRPKRKRPARRF